MNLGTGASPVPPLHPARLMSSMATPPPPDRARALRGILNFRNRQRDRRLDLRWLRGVVRHMLVEQLHVSSTELCFHFVGTEEMADVNWQFLQHEGSTDVITFDHRQTVAADDQRPGTLHGEAFICVADAVKQAREFRTTWQSEAVRYVVHALLHLQGYDDLQPAKRRVMKREENRVMRELARRFDLARLEPPISLR